MRFEEDEAKEKPYSNLPMPPRHLGDHDSVSIVVKIVRDSLDAHFGPESSRAKLSLESELKWLWHVP
eukprot:7002407-Pyramimonas_sp.AAC.1